MYRRLAGQVGIVLCGSALGIAAAYGIAQAIQLKAGRTELGRYASRLMRAGVELGGETDNAIQAVVADDLPFCSDQELAFLRNYVYNSPHVRDLGRVKDGKLYCSTGIGRLTMPRLTFNPDLVLGGMKIYAKVPLMISGSSTGFIVERSTVSVVINPDLFKSLDEPPKFYSGLLYDRANQKRSLSSAIPHR